MLSCVIGLSVHYNIHITITILLVWGSLVFRSGLIQNLCIISDNIHRNINGSCITISVMLALCSFYARGCLFSKLLQFYIIHLDKIEDLLYR